MKSMNLVRIALVTALILMVPLVAMQFSSEVDWNVGDFIVMGALLFGTGLVYEFVAGRSSNGVYRFAVGLSAVTSLLLIWVNLAVGIIGSEDNSANLMYGAVLAVGFLGAIASRLEPQGMAKVLFSMSFVQLLIPFVALLVWQGDMAFEPGVVVTFGANALFVVLFAGAGLLFRQAGTAQTAVTA
ncbi:MAG: hypothetical protein SGI90_09430 [Candidatus Eisenbacteria bacterium]|nr:hypothetical protein [Candidatus Eisenbacteria bacterium]